ncbi:hypothetical protein C0Q70_14726 [Pomacea canaliculata]|uniref:Uncharacterized protein n=1 Tax=Pomacea canaliculata TaxID=400727 RepID=A0A2T7NSW5_POMCA|nr:hypothetical protein C0Q70_14726 [Pomacea canaliculata]
MPDGFDDVRVSVTVRSFSEAVRFWPPSQLETGRMFLTPLVAPRPWSRAVLSECSVKREQTRQRIASQPTEGHNKCVVIGYAAFKMFSASLVTPFDDLREVIGDGVARPGVVSLTQLKTPRTFPEQVKCLDCSVGDSVSGARTSAQCGDKAACDPRRRVSAMSTHAARARGRMQIAIMIVAVDKHA